MKAKNIIQQAIKEIDKKQISSILIAEKARRKNNLKTNAPINIFDL